MTEPAVITVRPSTDLADARNAAEAALLAGRPVNVFILARDCRTLLVRAVPRGEEVLLQALNGTTTAKTHEMGRALRRQFARAQELLDAPTIEGRR